MSELKITDEMDRDILLIQNHQYEEAIDQLKGINKKGRDH